MCLVFDFEHGNHRLQTNGTFFLRPLRPLFMDAASVDWTGTTLLDRVGPIGSLFLRRCRALALILSVGNGSQLHDTFQYGVDDCVYFHDHDLCSTVSQFSSAVASCIEIDTKGGSLPCETC